MQANRARYYVGGFSTVPFEVYGVTGFVYNVEDLLIAFNGYDSYGTFCL